MEGSGDDPMLDDVVVSEPNSPVRVALERALASCRETAERLQAEAPEISEHEFVGALLLACSAFETALDTPAGIPKDTALMIAATLGHDTTALIRKHGLDDDLLRCAAACERAAVLCDQAAARLGDQPA